MLNPSRGGGGKLWVSPTGRSPGCRKDVFTVRANPVRWAFVAIAFTLSLGTSFATANEPTTTTPRVNPTVKAVQKIKPSVVAIKVPNATGKDPTGTGVIIDERGFIITNRHVVG